MSAVLIRAAAEAITLTLEDLARHTRVIQSGVDQHAPQVVQMAASMLIERLDGLKALAEVIHGTARRFAHKDFLP